MLSRYIDSRKNIVLMSENKNLSAVTKLIAWLKSLPIWARIVAVIVVAACAAVALFTAPACSATLNYVKGAGSASTVVEQSVDSTHFTVSPLSRN